MADIDTPTALPPIRFDRFAIDRANRELRCEGRVIALGSRYFDALVLLASHPGELVSKDRFMDEVWRGIPVTDEALTQCIRSLRRALGDEAGAPRFIATVPKHGYRFLGAVSPATHAQAPEAQDPATPAYTGARSGMVRGGRIAGAATIGGGIAGALGGLFYGAVATSGGAMSVLVLALLVAALGVLGGAGVGLGMGIASTLASDRERIRPLALAAGGALGGMLVGALGQALGSDGIAALTGARLPAITGLFEGLVLGLAVGMVAGVAWLSQHARNAAAIGAAAGALAGAAIALAGGNLLGGSLAALEGQFPASDLAMARIGRLLGDSGFGSFSRLVTAMAEGAVFAACIGAMLARWRPARPE